MVLTCVVPASQAAESSGELGILGGALMPDDPVTGPNGSSVEPVLGFRAAYFIGDRWSWSFDATFADIGGDTPAGDAQNITSRLSLERYFGDASRDSRWFVDVGSGVMLFDFDNASTVDRIFGSAGFGQQIGIGRLSNFRWELRADHTLNDDGLDGESVTQVLGLVGINWGRGRPPKDSDGDGVVDPTDECPGTAPGIVVDPRGCPVDRDGDGVVYGTDRCPDTPQGWPVGADGCPLDSDGDGVPDGADSCPGTPAGVTVDEIGCPVDGDGDGVFDGLDQCPDTPRGYPVGRDGCSLDSDGDGVVDGADRCPDTPAGTPVDERGCAVEASIELPGIRFELNSAVLLPNSKAILDELAGVLNLDRFSKVRLEIAGHTDSTGSDSYNQTLSEERSASVRDYLIGKGVAVDRLEAKGYGESRPVADNDTEEGRARNRRVELTKLD